MYYDKKATSAELQVEDKVLVRILAFSGPHKISDKYEQEVYEVMEQPHQDIPVYIVRSEDGIERKLHRNHLLPVGSSNGQKITEQENPVHQRPVPQPRRLPQKVSDEKVEQKLENGTVEEDIQSESSDSEDEGDVIYRKVIERPAGRRLRSLQRKVDSFLMELMELGETVSKRKPGRSHLQWLQRLREEIQKKEFM